jgi:ribosome-associated protein
LKILVDKGQKKQKHELKHNMLQKNGHELIPCPLPVGDYAVCTADAQVVIDAKVKRSTVLHKYDLCGTYSVCVDTKRDIQELIGDMQSDHERFRDELLFAQRNNIKLYILVDDNGGYLDRRKTIYNKPVTKIEDLFSWKNPRAFIFKGGRQLYPKCTKGAVLAKSLLTMEKKYGCTFLFCRKENAAERIVELLKGESDGE